MFAEQVSDVFIVDTSGLPSLIPAPLSEYVDYGDCIVREVIRDGGSGRTIHRRTIRKDTEEYRRPLSKATTRGDRIRHWWFYAAIITSDTIAASSISVLVYYLILTVHPGS